MSLKVYKLLANLVMTNANRTEDHSSIIDICTDIAEVFTLEDDKSWMEMEVHVASFFHPKKGALCILKQQENELVKKHLFDCFLKIVNLQLPFLKNYATSISEFIEYFLSINALTEIHIKLLDICNELKARNVLPNECIVGLIKKILENNFASYRPVNATFFEKLNVTIYVLEGFSTNLDTVYKKNILRDITFTLEQVFMRGQVSIIQENLNGFLCFMGYLLNYDDAPHNIINHFFVLMKQNLSETTDSLHHSDIWASWLEKNFLKIGKRRNYEYWFEFFQVIINSHSVSYLLKNVCARQYFKGCESISSWGAQDHLYEKCEQYAYETKCLELFDIKYFKYLINKQFDLIPPEKCVSFLNKILNRLYERFAESPIIHLPDCLELLTVLFFKCNSYFFENTVFFENYIFSAVTTYADSDCKDILIERIFLSIYFYDKFSSNIDNLVYEILVQQCSHKWIISYGDCADKSLGNYHRKSLFWLDIMSYVPNDCELDISKDDGNSLKNKICSSFVAALQRMFKIYDNPNFSNTNQMVHGQQLIATNINTSFKGDITIFENMVVLFKQVVLQIDNELSLYQLFDLFQNASLLIVKFPKINGFYVIIATCLVIMEKKNLFEDINSRVIKDQVCEYLGFFFQNINAHDGKLLIEFLEIVSTVPPVLILDCQHQMSLFFQNIFQNQVYGAMTINRCLNVIYRWMIALGIDKLEVFFEDLIPSLKFILFIKEEGPDTLKQTSTYKKNSYNSLLKIAFLLPQNLFLLLFNNNENMKFRFSKPVILNVETESKTISTMRLDHIIENVNFFVSETPYNKRKKAACELLHSLCVYCCSMNDSKLILTFIDSMIFSWGSITKDMQEMFKSLLFQTCHLFCSNQHYATSASAFIDVLLKGISYDKNSVVSNLSCECLNEFANFSLKSEDSASANYRALITKKICYQTQQKSSNKRIGSAKAFNCIGDIYLKESAYVIEHGINVLKCMIRSLKIYDEKNYELEISISHIKSAIIEFSDPQFQEIKDREQAIPIATMECLLTWLVKNSMSLIVHCRQICIKLIKDFYKGSPTFNYKDVFLDNFNDKFSKIQMLKDLESSQCLIEFWAQLDCLESYLFVYQYPDGVKTIEYIFQKINAFLAEVCTIQELTIYQKGVILSIVNFFFTQQIIETDLRRLFQNYFSSPSKLGFNAACFEEDFGKNMIKLFIKLPLEQRNFIEDQLAIIFCEMIKAFIESLQKPEQELLVLEQLNGFKFFITQIVVNNQHTSFMENWNFSPYNIMYYLKCQILNKNILDRTSSYKKTVLNQIITLALQIETTSDKKSFTGFFFNCEEPSFLNIHTTPEYQIFIHLKNIVCEYVLSNYNAISFDNFYKCPMQFLIIKQTLKWSYEAQSCKNNNFCNFILNMCILKWNDMVEWFLHRSREFCHGPKAMLANFLHTLAKSTAISFHRISHFSEWFWSSIDPKSIDFLKLLPYVTSPSSTILSQKLENGNISNRVFLDMLLNCLTSANQTNLLPFVWFQVSKNNSIAFILKIMLKSFNKVPSRAHFILISDAYNAATANNTIFEERLDVLKSGFLPLCYKLSKETILDFFGFILNELYNTVSEEIPNSNAVEEEIIKVLIKKAMAFLTLETMFGIMSESDVLKCFEKGLKGQDPINSRRELLNKSYLIRKSTPYQFDGQSYSTCWRQLQCAAFNCTVAIVCNTKKMIRERLDGCFYTKFIFSSYIDKITYAQHELTNSFVSSQTWRSANKIKISTSINDRSRAKSLNKNNNNNSMSLTVFSSFSQDGKMYDFVEKAEIPPNDQDVKRANQEFFFKKDSFNSHECMGVLCGAIFHTRNIGLTKYNVMPSWMKQFILPLDSTEVDTNGKLFILKVIYNCKNVFKPFAAKFFRAVINSAVVNIPPLPDQKLNYFLDDIVTMLVSWSEEIPKKKETLIWKLIDKILSSSPPNMDNIEVKRNIHLISELTNCWGPDIKNPSMDVLKTLIQSQHSRCQIVGDEVLLLLLKHKIVIPESFKDEIFNDYLVKINAFPKSPVTPVIVGHFLWDQSRQNISRLISRYDFTQKVEELLKKMFINNITNFAFVLYHIQKIFPSITRPFISHIDQCINNVKLKKIHSICLEILNNYILNVIIPNNFEEMLVQYSTIIVSNDNNLQSKFLQLLLSYNERCIDVCKTIQFVKPLFYNDKINENAKTLLCDILIGVNNKCSQRCQFDNMPMDDVNEFKKYFSSLLFDKSLKTRKKVLKSRLESDIKSLDFHQVIFFILEEALHVKSYEYLLGITTDLIMIYIKKMGCFDQNVTKFMHSTYKICWTEHYMNLRQEISHVPSFVESEDVHKTKKKSHSEIGIETYNYYHGDYPYSQMKLKDIIQPLLKLALLDEDFAKKLLITILNGICDVIKHNPNQWNECKSYFLKIFNGSLNGNQVEKHPIYPILFEVVVANNIISHSEINDLSTNMITKHCVINNIPELGILFLEDLISCDTNVSNEPAEKRVKLDSCSVEDKDTYLEKIISLYLSIDEYEVAMDIFGKNYSKRKDVLDSKLEMEKCYMLSDWKQLDAHLFPSGVCDISSSNIKSLMSREPEVFPYYVKSTVQHVINGNRTFQPHQFEKWAPAIKNYFDVELAMLCLATGCYEKLKDFSSLSIGDHTNKLFNIFRTKNVSREDILAFRTLIDLYMYSTKKVKNWTNFIDDFQDFYFKLQGDCSNYLDYKAVSRESFVYQINPDTSHDEHAQYNIEIIDYAVSKSNFFVAKKYLGKLCNRLGSGQNYTPLTTIRSKIKFEEVFLVKISLLKEQFKLEQSKQIWPKLRVLVEDIKDLDLTNTQGNILLRDLNYYVAKACSELIGVQQYSQIEHHHITAIKQIIMDQSSKNIETINTFDFPINGTKAGLFSLGLQCFMNKITFENDSRNIGESYLLAAIFCTKYCSGIDGNQHQFNLFFAKNILRAIKFGNKEAERMIPMVFTKSFSNIEESLVNEFSEVPTHIFLKWLPNLFAMLDKSKTIVPKLVEKIFQKYPSKASIPFLMWSEMSDNKTYTARLSEIAPECLKITERMIIALSQLCHPIILLRTYLFRLLRAYESGSEVSSILTEINEKCFYKHNSTFGKIYEMNNIHNDLFEMLQDKKISIETKCKLIKLKISELKNCTKKISETRLDQFSPWLANFKLYSGVIDVPLESAYSSNIYHDSPKIIEFSSKIEMVQSLRHPIKVTMLGSDGKRYTWLVKFGEDLRWDQIIQQLFTCMNQSFNKYLDESAPKIKTYQVIPLKFQLGIIEWIDCTTTLSALFESKISNNSQLRKKLRSTHEEWIAKHAVNESNVTKIFTSAVQRYSREEVFNHFHLQCQQVPIKLLRDCLLSLCTTMKQFFTMKMQFLKNYSVLSICHWVLGIGDRHLQNWLISLKSGDIIGIDFEYAFNIALRFSLIPELVPFRLTPNFYDLFMPLGDSGVLRHSMVRALDSIEAPIIKSIMQLFIQAPGIIESFNHYKSIRVRTLIRDPQRFLEDTIQIIEIKLNKQNPIILMEMMLKNGLLVERDAQIYCKLLKDEFGQQIHARMSSEQLVDCLINIARNKSILGLSAPTSEPWI